MTFVILAPTVTFDTDCKERTYRKVEISYVILAPIVTLPLNEKITKDASPTLTLTLTLTVALSLTLTPTLNLTLNLIRTKVNREGILALNPNANPGKLRRKKLRG